MKNSLQHVIAIVMLVSIILCGLSSFFQVSTVVNFDTTIAEDATPEVLAKVLRAKKNSVSEIIFEKGTYRFYPDKAFESFQYISNHGDYLVYTAFPLQQLENITIDGQGSTFIFHGRMIPFLINLSKNIHIKNISIDWADSFHSEGLVVANDLKNNTFDIQISEQYPYEIRNDQLIFIKEYYEHNLGQTILYDPKRKAITFNTESYTPLSSYSKTPYKKVAEKIKYKYKVDRRGLLLREIGRENKLKAEELKLGLVRIHNHAS